MAYLGWRADMLEDVLSIDRGYDKKVWWIASGA